SINRAKILQACELAEQCVALAQHGDDPGMLQDAHRMLGESLFFHGQPVLARTHLERSIALYDAQQGRVRAFSRGTEPGVICLSFLASTLWQLGYPDQALHRSNEALAFAQESSHAYSLALALQNAALLHLALREAQRIQEIVENMMTLAYEHGFPQWIAGSMWARGWALAEQGFIEEGIKQMSQGMTTWQTIGTELAKTHLLFRLAEAYGKGGQAKEGLLLLDNALAVIHVSDERYYEAEIYRLKGELLLAQEGKRCQVGEA